MHEFEWAAESGEVLPLPNTFAAEAAETDPAAGPAPAAIKHENGSAVKRESKDAKDADGDVAMGAGSGSGSGSASGAPKFRPPHSLLRKA